MSRDKRLTCQEYHFCRIAQLIKLSQAGFPFLICSVLLWSLSVLKFPYFSIDNAHLMYKAQPKFFDIPFDV
jgi:hypothetical protein